MDKRMMGVLSDNNKEGIGNELWGRGATTALTTLTAFGISQHLKQLDKVLIALGSLSLSLSPSGRFHWPL